MEFGIFYSIPFTHSLSFRRRRLERQRTGEANLRKELDKDWTLFYIDKKNPKFRLNLEFGIFYLFILLLFASEHFSENPDNNRNDKDYDKYPESHSGFKNVSYNFTA